MKAILVIDIGDMPIDKLTVDYDLRIETEDANESVRYVEDVPLRPMPKRYVEDDFVIETPRDAEACSHGVQVGRNIVINEILGENL